jgi:hypothetical protein
MSFFRVAEPDTNTQWSAVNRNVKKNKKFSSRFLREFFASTFPWFARHPAYTAPDESRSRRCVPEPVEKPKLPPGRSPAWLLKLISWPVGFFAALWLAVRRGYSFVGVFNRRADEVFVRVLRKWSLAWQRHRPESPG